MPYEVERDNRIFVRWYHNLSSRSWFDICLHLLYSKWYPGKRVPYHPCTIFTYFIQSLYFYQRMHCLLRSTLKFTLKLLLHVSFLTTILRERIIVRS